MTKWLIVYISLTACLGLQHNKRRTELHRLQSKHPELAAKIERQQARAAAHEDEDDASFSESESSAESDSEVSICLFSKGMGKSFLSTFSNVFLHRLFRAAV
jgi:hypothetical protein